MIHFRQERGSLQINKCTLCLIPSLIICRPAGDISHPIYNTWAIYDYTHSKYARSECKQADHSRRAV
jgi:hypothetical protein